MIGVELSGVELSGVVGLSVVGLSGVVELSVVELSVVELSGAFVSCVAGSQDSPAQSAIHDPTIRGVWCRHMRFLHLPATSSEMNALGRMKWLLVDPVT